MPVEQPTGIQLCINLKIAKALGFTIPSTLLASAGRAIEWPPDHCRGLPDLRPKYGLTRHVAARPEAAAAHWASEVKMQSIRSPSSSPKTCKQTG